jgi:hypothetical protein
MNEKLEEQLREIIAIAETCPELYKVECFKLLLQHQLKGNANEQSQITEDIVQKSDDIEEKKQREIKDSDLHIKFKKFMKDYSISSDKINQLFYFENGSFLGMYDDLKVTKMAEFQIRIALLQAMINAMSLGDFEFDGEAVRSECQKRKAYDLKNFATNFKNNINLFDGLDNKKGTLIKLSEIGKEELSKVIGEISS